MYGDLSVNNCPSEQTRIYQAVVLRQHRCGVFERWELWGGGRIVAATMVVGGVLSIGASAAGLTSNLKQILVCICMYSFSTLTVFFCLFSVLFVCICQ